MAAWFDSPEICQALLEKGVSPSRGTIRVDHDIQGRYGFKYTVLIAFTVAVVRGNLEVVGLFIDAGAPVIDRYGFLIAAGWLLRDLKRSSVSRNRRLQVIDLFLIRRSDINDKFIDEEFEDEVFVDHNSMWRTRYYC